MSKVQDKVDFTKIKTKHKTLPSHINKKRTKGGSRPVCCRNRVKTEDNLGVGQKPQA